MHEGHPRQGAHRTAFARMLERQQHSWAAKLFHIYAAQALLVLVATFVAGCAAPTRLPPTAANLTDQTTVLGIPNARFYPDTQIGGLAQEALRGLDRERTANPHTVGPGGRLPPANLLGISGGSDNGAFGAGLLVGWTAAGTRPDFKLVCGISTGALIAPFAFLGSAYDPQLRAVYTGIQPDRVYETRSVVTVLFSESFADTTPLFGLISHYVNEDMLAAIAREYAKGRLLLIGTTNIDEQRPVLWNIGAIAASGKPGALDLVRKLLLASAAVPGLFPPVMIDVELNGQHFQEMHVDGGVVAQMFLYPPSIGLYYGTRRTELARERHAYLIRNSRMDPEWASTDRRLFSIVGRAINTMIYYAGYNDAIRIYAASKHDGVDYNLAFIGSDFTMEHKVPFDQAYMRALFDYGYQLGRAGYPWRKALPILEAPAQTAKADLRKFSAVSEQSDVTSNVASRSRTVQGPDPHEADTSLERRREG
jgi:Patatin-like phospholipase